MNNKTYIIRQAYEILGRETPLSYDCGKLCNGNCCKGDNETGMFLFPGEEEIISKYSNFRIIECNGNQGYKMVVCNGECDRKTRPLVCRIYPYYPVIKESGFDVRADIRGIKSCPMLNRNIKPNYSFTRQIRKVARLLSRDEELMQYIIETNLMLDEIEAFAERMF